MEPALNILNILHHWLAEDSVDPCVADESRASRCGIIRYPYPLGLLRWSRYGLRGRRWKFWENSFGSSARTVVDCRGAWSGRACDPQKRPDALLTSAYDSDYCNTWCAHREHTLFPAVQAASWLAPRWKMRALINQCRWKPSINCTRAAAQFVPELASASVSENWAGLRPGTPDDLPIMGPTDTPGLFTCHWTFPQRYTCSRLSRQSPWPTSLKKSRLDWT